MKDKVFGCSNGSLLNNNIDEGESNGLPPGLPSSVPTEHLPDGTDCLQTGLCHTLNGSLGGQCANCQVFAVTQSNGILSACRVADNHQPGTCSPDWITSNDLASLSQGVQAIENHSLIDDSASVVEEGVIELMAPPHSEETAYRRVVYESQSRDLHFVSSPPIAEQPDNIGAELEQEEEDREHVSHVPTRLQILIDPANMCTFAGALMAVLAMASMWTGRYYLGMFFNVAANIADIIDGPIARSTPNRHPSFSLVGSKLDCYADLVSHFVVPASLLMHIGELSLFSVLLAGIYVCSGIMRQSYFEITGRCDGGTCIFGLTSDYMVGIYTLTMHLRPLIGQWQNLMLAALAVTILFMIYCSLTFSLRSRRYDGINLVLVTVYNVILCASCALLALYSDNDHILSVIASIFFPVLSILAYPLYFRHVEINR